MATSEVDAFPFFAALLLSASSIKFWLVQAEDAPSTVNIYTP